MESTPGPREQLADAERAAAAPYLDYPPTAAWYHPAVGAWAAGLVAALGIQSSHPRTSSIAIAVLLLVEAVALVGYRRKRRTMPSMRQVPPEIRAELHRYVVGVAVLLLVVLAAALLLPTVAAAGLTFVLVTTGVLLYERRYERAADATRARLS